VSATAGPLGRLRTRRPAISAQTRSEHRLGWMLSAPAVLAILLVAAYPIIYAVVLSLQQVDLRFPNEAGFIGLDNYRTVLTASLWWQDLANTVLIAVISRPARPTRSATLA
jgi:multiple sugar transport system permease protein